ncbi:hypothetical protein ACVW19_006241 [Streptomyces sp. TE5632]
MAGLIARPVSWVSTRSCRNAVPTRQSICTRASLHRPCPDRTTFSRASANGPQWAFDLDEPAVWRLMRSLAKRAGLDGISHPPHGVKVDTITHALTGGCHVVECVSA